MFRIFVQELLKKKELDSCDACGSSLSSKPSRKWNDSTLRSNRLCTACARVCYSFQIIFLSFFDDLDVDVMIVIFMSYTPAKEDKTLLWHMQEDS